MIVIGMDCPDGATWRRVTDSVAQAPYAKSLAFERDSLTAASHPHIRVRGPRAELDALVAKNGPTVLADIASRLAALAYPIEVTETREWRP